MASPLPSRGAGTASSGADTAAETAGAVPEVRGEVGEDGFIDLGVLSLSPGGTEIDARHLAPAPRRGDTSPGGARAGLSPKVASPPPPAVVDAADSAPASASAAVSTSVTTPTVTITANDSISSSPGAGVMEAADPAFPDLERVIAAEQSSHGPRPAAQPLPVPKRGSGGGAGAAGGSFGDSDDPDDLLAGFAGVPGFNGTPNAAVVAALGAAADAVPFDDIDDVAAAGVPDDDADLFAELEALGGLGDMGSTAAEMRASAAIAAARAALAASDARHGSPGGAAGAAGAAGAGSDGVPRPLQSPGRHGATIGSLDADGIHTDVMDAGVSATAGPSGAPEDDVTAEDLMADLMGVTVDEVRLATKASADFLARGATDGGEGVIDAGVAEGGARAPVVAVAGATGGGGGVAAADDSDADTSSSSSSDEDLSGVPVLDAETAAASEARERAAEAEAEAVGASSPSAARYAVGGATTDRSDAGGGASSASASAGAGSEEVTFSGAGAAGARMAVEEVVVHLPRAPFGMALRAVLPDGTGAQVDGLFEGQAAKESGAVREGDVIVKVGMLEVGRRHFNEIVAVLKQAGDAASMITPATLTFARRVTTGSGGGIGAATGASAGTVEASDAEPAAAPAAAGGAAAAAAKPFTLDFAMSGGGSTSAKTAGTTGAGSSGDSARRSATTRERLPADPAFAAGLRALMAPSTDVVSAPTPPAGDAAAATRTLPPSVVSLTPGAATKLQSQFEAEQRRYEGVDAEAFVAGGSGARAGSSEETKKADAALGAEGDATSGAPAAADVDAAAAGSQLGPSAALTEDAGSPASTGTPAPPAGGLVGDPHEGVDPRERNTDVCEVPPEPASLPFSPAVSAHMLAGLNAHLASMGLPAVDSIDADDM